MLCPNCNTENRPEAKFCDQCGNKLTLDQSDNADGAKEIDAEASLDSDRGNDDEFETDYELYQPVDSDDPENEVDEPIETDYELYQPVDSEDTDSFDPGAAIDKLAFAGSEMPALEAGRTHDLSGFDTASPEYEERLVDASYKPPVAQFRDGGTIEMQRVEGEEPQKSKDYLSSSATKRKGRGKLIALIVAVVVIAAGVAAFSSYQAGYWGGTIIPDVVGMTEADAKSILEEKGFSVRIDQVKSDDTEGLVLLMDPAAGQRGSDGDEIVIHVARARTIPQVVGKSEEEAKKALAAEGFENVKTKKKSSEQKEGTVLEVSPKAGESALSTAEITLTLAAPYTVPDVANKSFDDAVKALKDAGLGYDVLYVDTEEYPEGTIIGTDPAAGSTVNKGDYIMIEIAQDHGSVLEELAREALVPGVSLEKGGTNYTIESLDSVSYIGNNTVSYTATCRPYTFFFGETFSSSTTQSVSGTVVFDENNQVIAIS